MFQTFYGLGKLMVSLSPMTGTVKPYSWTKFTCSYESPDELYINFKLSPFRDSPLTASNNTPDSIVRTVNGASRTWHVHVQLVPCNVECYIQDRSGKELIKVVTSVTPGLTDHITEIYRFCLSLGNGSTMGVNFIHVST